MCFAETKHSAKSSFHKIIVNTITNITPHAVGT